MKKTSVILLALIISLLTLTSTALADRGGIVDLGVSHKITRTAR